MTLEGFLGNSKAALPWKRKHAGMLKKLELHFKKIDYTVFKIKLFDQNVRALHAFEGAPVLSYSRFFKSAQLRAILTASV